MCKSAEIVSKDADPHNFVGSVKNFAILKGAAGDLVNDGIYFMVAVLLGSKDKTCGIGKEGDSEGGRRKIRSGRKIHNCSNSVQATFREDEQRFRAQGVVATGNRVVVFRGNEMRYWWCRNGHHPRRKGRGSCNRRKGRTGKYPQRWCNKKGGESSSRYRSDCRRDGGGEKT